MSIDFRKEIGNVRRLLNARFQEDKDFDAFVRK